MPIYKGEYDKAWSDVHKAQSLGYQVSPKFLEALRTAEAMAAAFTFKEISRTEKILNNGKEPRRKLRYEFQPGKKHILVMTMQTDMSIEVGDYRQPETKSPVIQMNVGINCQEVSQEGNLHYVFKFDTVEIIDEMGMPPEQVAVTKANMKNIEGISGWMIVSPRGATIDGKFNVPPNFNPILKQMLDNLFNQFQNLSVIFPEQPVGIDSQWQVVWHFAKPSEIIQVAKFKLLDLKGNKGKLKVSVEQNAKPHKAEFPNLSTGSTVRIESMKSTGTGTIIFDLTTLVPTSEAEIGTSVKGKVEAGDEKVDIDMDINMRVKIQSARYANAQTPFMGAAQKGDTEKVQALVAQGADVNAKANNGITALMFAAYEGHTDTVQALVAQGADVNAKANDGGTALMQAAYEGHTDTVQALLEKGVDANAKANNGSTALMFAAYEGHTDTVQALVAQGADVNAKDNNGITALMKAAYEGHTDTVQALVAKGADVNAKDNDGATALMQGAFLGHIDTVQALLEKGADANAKDNTGVTALMLAAGKGHTDAVQALLEKGADINAKANKGFSALIMALAGGHKEIIRILKEAGAKE
jgi:ankyrin repeat protein